ncbi:MAG: hypothetical protein U5N55_05120 [Cypionkella sp.]|nr:hypothetical protein [Cypionkella sp.]
MTLTIENGKYYRTRDGRKVGPMSVPPRRSDWGEIVIADCKLECVYIGFPKGGRYGTLYDHPLDLIAEWTDTDKATAPRKPKRKWHKTADKPPPEDVHLLGWWADFVPAFDCFMKEHGSSWVGRRETILPDYWRKLPKGPKT